MATYKKPLIISLVALALVAAGVLLYLNRPIAIPVDLTPEQRAEYEAKVAEYDDKIKNEEPTDELGRPEMDYFVEKARYQEYLGRLSDAVKTLKQGLKLYQVSTAAWHNIAKLYEKMGRYGTAIKYYQTIISEVGRTQYYMDIARAARAAGDAKLAQDAYWAYETQYPGVADPEFEEWLRENAPPRNL